MTFTLQHQYYLTVNINIQSAGLLLSDISFMSNGYFYHQKPTASQA